MVQEILNTSDNVPAEQSATDKNYNDESLTAEHLPSHTFTSTKEDGL